MMPLDGVRVIDASSILAGPLAAQILGDHGADVIKIEHPIKGDSMRGHGPSKDGVPIWWKEISRNKRHLALNLGKPAGAEVLKRMIADTDVLVENFRPGTFEKWGLGPDVLHEINPGLIITRLTGFGQQGPYAQRPGFGTLVEAMSGFAHLTGPADAPPTLPAFGLADTIAGISASSAILMALRHRDKTGEGQVVDVDLLSPILTAAGPGPSAYDLLGTIGSRNGNRSSNNAPRNTYLTQDGKWVAISTSAQSIAERVMQLVGHPEVISEPWFASGAGRVQHVDLLDGYVSDWIGARDRDEVMRAFTEAGAAVAPVYDARDIVEDRHVRGAEILTEVEDEDFGTMLQHNLMWRLEKSPGGIRFTGRDLGADTDAIMAEFGYSDEEIASLRESELIK